MKTHQSLLLILLFFTFGCSNNSSNSPEFITQSSGKYLFNPDETIEIYFEENELLMKWRGANEIKPMKIDNNTFFVKEMNEKIQFLTNPSDNRLYISLVPKEKNQSIEYNFRKLNEGENIPSMYLENNQFDKALIGYLSIQKSDSLSPAIQENYLNSKGYNLLRTDNTDQAINIFKVNTKLYPNSSNVYDSLGDALLQKGDTIEALKNFKKSLELDSGNKKAKRLIEKMTTKK
ncbi:tetratricopeptide repeat protein [Urechidicola croceus]|uniref:Uncharacterized protein n=1 Tax=Urechidicola croceus TaxID=1850246 RepID=A0A1D8P5N6_9FLAO|nr:hypothetical protein [Urechidicola croceus]AOW19902.1 hypothetical protein LPB138_04045 [Urechidicola croceus]